MIFMKALDNIKKKQSRKAGTKAYYNKGEVYFSRLFGYALVDGVYMPIPEYANAMKLVFSMLNTGSSLPSIKQKLDTEGYRDSSHNRYCLSRIESLVRPIYAGYLEKGISFVKVNNLIPIVSLQEYRSAARALRKEIAKIR